MCMGNGPRIYDRTIDRALGRARRSIVSWLGLVLLAFNILGVGAVSARPVSAGVPLFAQALSGEHVVVCTAAGMVAIDVDGTPQGDGDHRSLCAFCLPFMQGGADVPVAHQPPLPLKSPVAEALFVAWSDPVRLIHPAASAAPRAPPLS